MLLSKEQEQWQENLLVTERGIVLNIPWQAREPERPVSVVDYTCNSNTGDWTTTIAHSKPASVEYSPSDQFMGINEIIISIQYLRLCPYEIYNQLWK